MNIFDYNEYRNIIKHLIAIKPRKGRGLIGSIAKYIGAHPTVVSLVLHGDREFSQEQAFGICNYFGFSQMETEYFLLLLQYERAGTTNLKNFYKLKIEEIKKNSLNIAKRMEVERKLTDLERAIFYSKWTYMATWLFLAVDDGQTLESVMQRFSIPRPEAIEIINFLKSVGLCSLENGLYKVQSQYIHLEFGSPFLARHHSNWRIKALQRIDDLSEDELMYTVPFAISKKDFALVRENLLQVIKSSMKTILASPSEEVACMTIDLFWIRK